MTIAIGGTPCPVYRSIEIVARAKIRSWRFITTSLRLANGGGLDVVVVADAAGIVVAGAGAWAACEELAASAAASVWLALLAATPSARRSRICMRPPSVPTTATAGAVMPWGTSPCWTNGKAW